MDKRIWLVFPLFIFLILPAIALAAAPYFDIGGQFGNASTNTTTHYSIDGKFNFQINCSDADGNLMPAIFEANFVDGSTHVNYTNSTTSTPKVINTTGSSSTEMYYINWTYAQFYGAGNYNYTWYCNDSALGVNATGKMPISIPKNITVPVTVNITTYSAGDVQVNTTDSNPSSIEGQGFPYADCWFGRSAGDDWSTSGLDNHGTTATFRDDATWTKGSSGATSLGVGTYTVKCNTTGNTNFTNNATGASFSLSVIAAGGGGGGNGGVVTTQPATTQPFWQPPTGEWQFPELNITTVIVILIIIAVLASGKKKK